MGWNMTIRIIWPLSNILYLKMALHDDYTTICATHHSHTASFIIIIMFIVDPVGPVGLVQCNILKHKCRHFVPQCRAVGCQALNSIQF